MANILILSIVFPPDGASTAHIVSGLSEGFLRNGHRITIITTTPHNNINDHSLNYSITKKYLFSIIQKSNFKGMNIFRIQMPRKSKSRIKRFLSWGWFSLACIIVPLFIREKFDLIFCCSPPLSIGLSADFISRAKRAPFIYNVQEIYPDIAILSGYIKNKILISFLFGIERYIYKRASHITVIGDVMSNILIKKGVMPNKLSVIPNYANTIFFRHNYIDSFRTQYNLRGKFIFGYAGNFGIAQDIRLIIELAERLKHNCNVHFLLAGSGIFLKETLNLIKKFNLENVTILGYLDHANMPDFYSSADVLFVPLKAELASTAFPSKAIEIMASGKPIIAITDKESDLAGLVERAKCGFVVDSKDGEKLYQIALECIENRAELNNMGINGLNYIKENMSIDRALTSYINIFGRTIDKRH